MCQITYHTGEHKGFSWEPCAKCGSALGGDRWEWLALVQKRTHAPIAENRGDICADCFDEINHEK